MLDIEQISVSQDGLSIVSLVDMKKHRRILSNALDEQITAAIKEAADKLHGLDGELNRAIFPSRWRRYLPAFPSGRIIRLPFPPLRSVVSIAYEDGEGTSPATTIDSTEYILRKGYIGEIEMLRPFEWPSTPRHPRAVCITFDAGYDVYPEKLKRMVKILASTYLSNTDATVNESRLTAISHKVEFGMDSLRAALHVPVSYDDWE